MMYPILCKVRYESLHLLMSHRALWIQIGISFVLNWIVAPLFMVGLAWAFLPDRQDLREGLIFVGIARCIAMVLIWTDLAKGDGDYCAVLVAFNSLLQIILFAPLSVFYIKIISHSKDDVSVSYSKVATSVAVFLGKKISLRSVTYILNYVRNPPGSRHPHPPHPPALIGRWTIPKQIHPLYQPTLPHRPPLHHHRSLRLARSTCHVANHLCPPCLRATARLLPCYLHLHYLAMSQARIRVPHQLHAELHRC